MIETKQAHELGLERIKDCTATIAVVGMGYVGLPLASALFQAGYQVLGFDVDSTKVEKLNAGKSYIRTIGSDRIAEMIEAGRFRATTELSRLQTADAVLICVPTPLNKNREPDLSYVECTAKDLSPHVRPGQLFVLESTTYPGTTKEVMVPVLEEGGLVAGRDFYVAYSPEREDPGNERFQTSSIPKVVGADDDIARELAVALYERVTPQVVPVSTASTAEAVKLTENIFRAVNIALVNELKVVFEKMDIDVWEVIEAAKTKPFGFMPFYPGPGLGGHCIPIDPFYLTWKAREYGVSTRFIELAGEINTHMPQYVIAKLAAAVDRKLGRGLRDLKILILGVAYKKNVDDPRESPAFVIMEELQKRQAQVSFYDPFVPVTPEMREHPSLSGLSSIEWSREAISTFDAALVVTGHDGVDYQEILDVCPVVVDTRNVTAGLNDERKVVVKS